MHTHATAVYTQVALYKLHCNTYTFVAAQLVERQVGTWDANDKTRTDVHDTGHWGRGTSDTNSAPKIL